MAQPIAPWAEQLYRRHGTAVYRLCLSMLKDPAAAEDAAQETFYKVCRSGPAACPTAEKAWLLRIAHNTACDLLRQAGREVPSAPGDGPEPADPAAADGNLEFLELIAPLRGMDRSIVCLRIVGGLTAREIAPIVRMTPKAVQKRYERALAALRRAYEEGQL